MVAQPESTGNLDEFESSVESAIEPGIRPYPPPSNPGRSCSAQWPAGSTATSRSRSVTFEKRTESCSSDSSSAWPARIRVGNTLGPRRARQSRSSCRPNAAAEPRGGRSSVRTGRQSSRSTYEAAGLLRRIDVEQEEAWVRQVGRNLTDLVDGFLLLDEAGTEPVRLPERTSNRRVPTRGSSSSRNRCAARLGSASATTMPRGTTRDSPTHSSSPKRLRRLSDRLDAANDSAGCCATTSDTRAGIFKISHSALRRRLGADAQLCSRHSRLDCSVDRTPRRYQASHATSPSTGS